jgi:hypothetical protein
MPGKAMAHFQQVWQFNQTVGCLHLRGHLGNEKTGDCTTHLSPLTLTISSTMDYSTQIYPLLLVLYLFL